MSFWRKTFGKDDDAPPPIERRRKPPTPSAVEPSPPATAQAAASPQPARTATEARPEVATAPQGVSVLAAGVVLEGTLSGRGTVRIDGQFLGRVRLDGTLVVGPEGQVRGPTIVARRVLVEGTLRGPVLAEYVEIGATGRLWGDVTTTAFVTREGAFLRGRVRMEEKVALPLESAAEAPASAPAAETAVQNAPPISAPEEAADDTPPPTPASPAAQVAGEDA